MGDNKKTEAIRNLEFLCGKRMEKEGTLLDSFSLCYEVRREIMKCYAVGVARMEIGTILARFGQSF